MWMRKVLAECVQQELSQASRFIASRPYPRTGAFSISAMTYGQIRLRPEVISYWSASISVGSLATAKALKQALRDAGKQRQDQNRDHGDDRQESAPAYEAKADSDQRPDRRIPCDRRSAPDPATTAAAHPSIRNLICQLLEEHAAAAMAHDPPASSIDMFTRL